MCRLYFLFSSSLTFPSQSIYLDPVIPPPEVTNSCTAEFHPGGLDDCQHQHSPVSPLQQGGGENIGRTDITRACVEVEGGGGLGFGPEQEKQALVMISLVTLRLNVLKKHIRGLN